VKSRRRWRHLWLALLLALVTLAGAGSSPLAAERPNGAGLVIRFGDGRIVTAYVEFDEPAITGIELLERSGIPFTVAPFGGLGLAVCAIAGEGCPAEDCFCQAKSQPAWFWHYYGLTPDGRWVLHSVGASSRIVRDGDVDGWSWTAGESGLPAITIDEIARAHGVERNPPPAPTAIPTPVPPPPTAPPTIAPSPTPSPNPTPPPTPPLAARANEVTVTAAPTRPAVPSPTARPTPTPVPIRSPAATATTPTATTVVVPSPTVSPEPARNGSGPPWSGLGFVGLAGIVLLVVLVTRLRGRRA